MALLYQICHYYERRAGVFARGDIRRGCREELHADHANVVAAALTRTTGDSSSEIQMVEASPGMAVLFLSLYLLNTSPSVQGGSLFESSLYLTCKQLFSFVTLPR